MQQELFLGRVVFREDVVMVIEKIERLRELEGILCDEGRLLRTLVDLAMKFGSNGSPVKLSRTRQRASFRYAVTRKNYAECD